MYLIESLVEMVREMNYLAEFPGSFYKKSINPNISEIVEF